MKSPGLAFAGDPTQCAVRRVRTLAPAARLGTDEIMRLVRGIAESLHLSPQAVVDALAEHQKALDTQSMRAQAAQDDLFCAMPVGDAPRAILPRPR